MSPVVKVACPHCGDELTIPSTACRLVLAGQANEFLSARCPNCGGQINKLVPPPIAGELLGVGVKAVDIPGFPTPTGRKPLTEDDLIDFGLALQADPTFPDATGGGEPQSHSAPYPRSGQ